MYLPTPFIRKALASTSLLSILFTPSLSLAVNPPQPFTPSDNVLDPNCLPTDSNCYVSINNLSLTSATTTSLAVLANTTLGGDVSFSGATSTITQHTFVEATTTGTWGTWQSGTKWITVSPTDGYARYVYHENNASDLSFIQCLNDTCTNKVKTVIATGTQDIEFPQIAMGVDNLPRVTYVKYSTPNEIHHVQCLNESCSSNSNVIVATSSIEYFYEQSVSIGPDGFARIVYEDYDSPFTNAALRLVTCTTLSCSSYVTTTIATSSIAYFYPSVQTGSDNLTKIAYSHIKSSINIRDLYLASCSDVACSTSTSSLLEQGMATYIVSMDLNSFNIPHIAYEGTSTLRYLQCLDVACTTKNITTLKDGIDYPYLSMQLATDDTARIVYTTATDGVSYLQCFNSACSSSSGVLLDSSDDNRGVSLAFGLDGLSNIAYISNWGSSVTFVKLLSDDGRPKVTGQIFGSLVKGIGEMFASRITTNLLNVATVAIAGVVETNIIQAPIARLSHFVIKDSITGDSLVTINKNKQVGIGVSTSTERLTVDGNVYLENGSYRTSLSAFGFHQNLLKYSEELNQSSSWSNVGAATITTNATTSPDGTLSAERILQANTTQWALRQGISATSTGSYTFSIWLKTESATGTMYFDIGDNICYLADGTSAIYVTQEWKRYSCTSLESSDYSNGVFVDFNSGYSMKGSTYYAWGAQLVYGTGAGAYTRTVGSSISNESLSVRDTSSESFFLGKLGVGTSTLSTTFFVQGRKTENPFLISSSTGSTLFSILQNGNVGIGTTTPSYLLQVGNASTSGVVSRFENSTGYCDINPTTTSLTCTSDMRLKKNIVPLDASTTLSHLTQLNAVTYNWLTEDSASSTHAGFIAQEVQPLFPDLVSTDENGTLSVAYGGFVPYIIQSIKYITAQILSFRDSFTTKRLCVGEGDAITCLTKEQVDTILHHNQSQTEAVPTQSPVPESSTPVAENSTTTSTSSPETTDPVQATTTPDNIETTTAPEEVSEEKSTEVVSDPSTSSTFSESTSTVILENNQ